MENKKESSKAWYAENRYLYEKLSEEIEDLLKETLDDKKITYIDIMNRAKTMDSFTEKCKKEKYIDPIVEIHDLAGIRITAYTNSEVDKIAKVIEDEFEIDWDNSVDKKKVIEVDRFGYLSTHYVASLKEDYMKIAKYSKYKGLKFEIQVRTLLQHVWSELEHDRNYKFKGALPKELKRRFYMIAGVLELVDKEFDLLTEDITKYSNDIERRIKNEDFNLELSDTSVRLYMEIKRKASIVSGTCDDEMIDELHRFDIYTISNIDELIARISDENMYILIKEYEKELHVVGFLRDLMVIDDAEKYFSSWKDNWIINQVDINYFKQFGIELEEYLNKYNIITEEDDEA